MKIITTAAALKFLGPDYKYQTKICLAGDTLIIIGAGDPLLGDKVTDTKHDRKAGWILDDIITALKENNITEINDIIVDTGIFDDQRVHPNWPKNDLNRWYASEVCGLNYNGNCTEITVENINGKIKIINQPNTSFLKIINRVTPVQSGKSVAGCYRNHELNTLIVKGKCQKQVGPFLVAIERPAAWFAFLLAEKMVQQDISVKGQVIEKPTAGYTNLKTIRTYETNFSDCLARCNKDSFGLAAECLLKTIAANETNKDGSWTFARKLVSQYLLKLGIEAKEFYIDDASGLSRENLLSANAITKVLKSIYETGNWKMYRDSLAAGGVDGTIGKYFKESKYKAKVLGKTGYINGVKSFSGICITGRGDYIFSVLSNNANGNTRKVLNDIAKAIIDYAE